MKKILFVHYSLVCGGVETALLNLCSMLNKKKYEVTVLEYSGWGDVLKPQFLEKGIRVITPYSRLQPGKNIIHKSYNVLKQKCIERRLKRKRVFLKEAFDIVVYYQVTDVRVECISKPKIVSYIHGDIATNEHYRQQILLQKSWIMESDKIVCVSNRAKDSLAKFAGISEKTIVLYNPINSDNIYSCSKEETVEQIERPYICAVGRLSPEKRFDSLVRVHKNLLDKGAMHDLVIIGDGNERDKIERAIKDTETETSVHLLGFKENPYPYIKKSLFTVCSSETEGLSVVSMESLLLGRPVVSSYPTVGELFGKEICGVITEISTDSLEDGIYRMLTDQAFYKTCVVGAESRSEYFDSKKMVQQVEMMFDEIL